MPSHTEAIRRTDTAGLALIVSSENVSSDLLVLQAYSQDLWPRKLLELREGGPQPPTVDAVCWPRSTEEVAQIMKWASKVDITLYPYGAGSGVCGASIPQSSETRPRVVVDLKKIQEHYDRLFKNFL